MMGFYLGRDPETPDEVVGVAPTSQGQAVTFS
jgi:hypothetical protein